MNAILCFSDRLVFLITQTLEASSHKHAARENEPTQAAASDRLLTHTEKALPCRHPETYRAAKFMWKRKLRSPRSISTSHPTCVTMRTRGPAVSFIFTATPMYICNSN